MNKNYYIVFFLLLGAVFYLPFLGRVPLFDWDEINFAESAREMLVSGNYTQVQINYHPFWEKPPLFFWLQAVSMHLFGVNEFAARFPNAVFGIVTLLTLFVAGRRWHGTQFGFWWALAYWGSFLPHFYFKSGIIDPVFNYFIFLGIIFLAEALHIQPGRSKQRGIILAGSCAGLAVLTKGPVGFLLIALTTVCVAAVLWWQYRNNRQQLQAVFPETVRIGLFLKACLLFLLPMLFVASFWFIPELLQNGPDVLVKFIKYQIRLFATPDAGHRQPFFYHWVVVLLGCFPMSVAALPAFLHNNNSKESTGQRLLQLWMICLFMVVLVVFTIVKTKIVHYSSLAYLPLSYLAARYIYRTVSQSGTGGTQATESVVAPLPAGPALPVHRYVRTVLLLAGTVFGLVLALVPLAGKYKTVIAPLLKDPFARGCLEVPVAWTGWECLPGLLYLLLVWAVVVTRLKTNAAAGWGSLFAGTAVVILAFTPWIAPKIEQHSQGTVINFYKSMQGKPVYVEPIGFKSYAHYFYFNLPPGHCPPQYSDKWLLEGNIDKPAYLITKITKTNLVSQYPDVQLLNTTGGFAFFVRQPPEKGQH
ncbi:glycosyltransferase family 39 protein [Sphingobacteriales bacterium UPWRP_1]|nr:hypothetical protein BVG80_12175 [Sphingobacteriales bacterium TSM_CSM]PSJ75823.1 glycosyltransferase family 39 protein [Sphingobacteriales bacterium UPWRP_1]